MNGTEPSRLLKFLVASLRGLDTVKKAVTFPKFQELDELRASSRKHTLPVTLIRS